MEPLPTWLTPNVFNLVVQFIYQDRFTSDASRSLFDLYRAGSFFEIPTLVDKAETKILRRLRTENAVRVFMKAKNFNLGTTIRERSRELIIQ